MTYGVGVIIVFYWTPFEPLKGILYEKKPIT